MPIYRVQEETVESPKEKNKRPAVRALFCGASRTRTADLLGAIQNHGIPVRLAPNLLEFGFFAAV
jgi:hypothetical protein